MTASLMFGLALVGVGYLWVQHSKRDRVAAEVDRDESARWFQMVRELPETTVFDPPTDLARARLRSLPSPHLSVVPDPPIADDIEWVFAADLFIPQQRRPGGAS